MNKSCARCSKTVYPIEELKCLDKSWHKACFKCTECGMTLNMKTYKGFNKNPYCEAHVPKAKATTIAETPELKRIAENTKIQSNVKYHAEFEKQKGKVTQVADDPETLRLKQNTKNISNVAYHGDLQKKAAMEKQREFGEVVDNKDDHNESEYFSETLAAESLPHYQPPVVAAPNNVTSATNNSSQQHLPPAQHHPEPPTSGNLYQAQQAQNIQQRYYDQYENYARPNPNNTQQNYTNNNHHASHAAAPAPNNGYGGGAYNNGGTSMTTSQHQQYQNNSSAHHYMAQNYAQQPAYYATQTAAHGGGGYPASTTGNGYNHHLENNSLGQKITDYDPLNDGSRTHMQHHRTTNDRSGALNMNQNRTRTAEIDTGNGYYDQQVYYQQQQQQIQQQQMQQQQAAKQHKPMSRQRVYRALYAYEAQDDDEVSFKEGDLIFEMTPIEGGWLTGRVESTGKSGMLPANYVEQAVI
ncbi:LIM and SH3 domain protein Lasp isoform X1 [Culicoides brevitarsis]|uniref:LIM and SH3 domain protein Lasp isoform X1 n=1 Tax=Culicoides brevitarsis TaxID=469753 RepID=UPI00307CB42F